MCGLQACSRTHLLKQQDAVKTNGKRLPPHVYVLGIVAGRLLCTVQPPFKNDSVMLFGFCHSVFGDLLLLEANPQSPDSPGTSLTCL